MTKRVTLTKLISYILSNCSEKIDIKENNLLDIAHDNVNNEELNFNNLNFGDYQSINNFPEFLKEIFDPFLMDIKRFGVIKSFKSDNNINISLFYSLLFCLDEKFIKMNNDEQELYIIKLKDKLLNDLVSLKLFKTFNYKKLSWKQKELKESIKNFKNNKMVLRYLTDYFNINIFLLNILEDKIYAIYPEELFNIFKMNIFLVFYNDIFEPLVYKENKLWNYNLGPFKKLINVNRAKIIPLCVNLSKKKEEKNIEFKIGNEDLDKYLNIDIIKEKNKNEKIINKNEKIINKNEEIINNDEEIIQDNEYNEIYINRINKKLLVKDIEDTEIEQYENNDESSIFYKKKNIVDKSEIKKINELNEKMKLIELQELAKKHNLDIVNINSQNKKKNKTKSQLIKELKELIKNNNYTTTQ